MIKHIIVENHDRVGNFIGLNLEFECDLLESNDEKVINFLNKYSEYIYSNKCEKLKEFYQLTGLIVTHECQIDNDYSFRKIVYSMNNTFDTSINSNLFNKPIYTTHILVVSNNDLNDYLYRKSLYNKSKINYKLSNEIRYNLSCICTSIKGKIHHIEQYYDKNAFKFINKKEVKQIELTVLNNLCILLKNGDLYFDGRLYSRNVCTIWHQDSYNSYIIYKDNSLESLISDFPNSNRVKHKKIVYNKNVLASLYKKNVHLTILTDIPDSCIMTTFIGIDDIESTNNSIYLIIGKRKIRIPSIYNTIIVNN